jgi:hypothetical protein
MKKGTILRNEAPHAVQMPKGSKVAARKVKKEAASVPVPDEVPPPPVAQKSVSPKVKTAKAKPAPVKVATKPRAKAKAPAPTPASARAKARAKPKAPDTIAPAQGVASIAPASVLAPRILPTPIDEAAIWEKDSPIKTRMSQLKARNALLEEQLQRLQSPFQARGRKP